MVDSLMGKTLALMKPVIEKLETKDANPVATEIRNRIASEGEYINEPKGIVGLTAIAEKFPPTRAPLLQLIKSIPAEKIGSWGGHTLQKLAVYPETAEAKTLLEELAKVNKRIEAFIKATTKTKK